MPRYYFHLEDGQCLLDEHGLDLPDIVAAQDEALRTSGNLLKGGSAKRDLWNGAAWRLWVTLIGRMEKARLSSRCASRRKSRPVHFGLIHLPPVPWHVAPAALFLCRRAATHPTPVATDKRSNMMQITPQAMALPHLTMEADPSHLLPLVRSFGRLCNATGRDGGTCNWCSASAESLFRQHRGLGQSQRR
jgi:hypothetical protein